MVQISMPYVLFETTKELVKTMVGNDYLYFDDMLDIKIQSNSQTIWGISVSHSNDLYLMDADEHWYELTPEDRNFDIVAPAVYNRIEQIRVNRFQL